MTPETVSAKTASPCVVLDTNIWRSELLLRSPLGAALLYSLSASQGCLGLPEVIYDEVGKQIIRAGIDATQRVSDSLRILEKILGARPSCSLPTEDKLSESVSTRFEQLEQLLHRIPFTLKHARAALRRVNEETPPNGPKKQQFKDSAIWESVLDLSKIYTVHFVTSDKGFFEGRDPKKGLANNLLVDCKRIDRTIHVYSDLADCLDALRKDVPRIDEAKLANAIADATRTDIRAVAAARSFQIADLTKHSVTPFLTEEVDKLSLIFELTYQLVDIPETEEIVRTDPTVIVKGNCSYSLTNDRISDVHRSEEEFRWYDENGNARMNRNVYVHVGFGMTAGGPFKIRTRIT